MVTVEAELSAGQVSRSPGAEMHRWARDLWPICRSLTGDGVRQTLSYLQEILPGLTQHEVATGTQCFDWTVPNEWNVSDAYVLNESGERVIDFRENNLHLVGYSVPVDVELSLEELEPHLYSLPDQPTAIPYVTSYYAPRWGFCLAHERRQALEPGRYRAVVKSRLEPGSLTYGELILPGEESTEVLLSTYVCHPSMANNELSGPVVAAALARWLAAKPRRRHTYRIVFLPETIGAIVYMSRNLEALKKSLIAGWVLTCVGDERAYSFMPSRTGDTLADRVSRHVLSHHAPGYVAYDFLQRGSDERQYCSPLANLPVASIMRSKYGVYPEYHTSLDDLTLVTPEGLKGAWLALSRCIDALEANCYPVATVVGEPQLGRRGLYPTLSRTGSARTVRPMVDFLAHADGTMDLIAVADRIGVPVWECAELLERLEGHKLIERGG